MSYSWYGKFKKPPTLVDLDVLFRSCEVSSRICISEQRRGDVGGSPFVLRDPEGSDDLSQPFVGRFVNVYVPKKSAAGIEVTWDDEHGLRIRCLALASTEDYDLALGAVRQLIAENKRVRFTDEEDEPVNPVTMQDVYGPEFRRDQQYGGCASLALRAEQLKKREWFVVQTPVRPFFVDSTFFKVLRQGAQRSRSSTSREPGARLTKEVLSRLKRLVALSSGPSISGVTCPSKITVTLEGHEVIGEFYSLGTKTILCQSDEHVIVSAPSERERLVVGWEKLVAVLKKRMEWLDARQVLLPELAKAEVKQLFAAASKKADAVYVTE